MKLKISYPNDYGSEAAYHAADEFFGGNVEDMGRELGDLLLSMGGKFLKETDFGGIWEFAEMPQLPNWAGVEILTHGGARKGSGTKPGDGATGLKRTNISIDYASADILRQFGDGDLSLGIRRAAAHLKTLSQ